MAIKFRPGLGLLAAAALGLMASTAHAEVKIGALFPFSGALALLGDESWRGVELAGEEFNAAGGIDGEQVVFVRGDAVDNNQAIAEARRLISVEEVKAIFGTYSSSRSQVASQVAELAGIPYFELGAVSDDITGRGFQYLFRTNPTAKSMAERTVQMITEVIAPRLGVEPGSLKIGIIHEDSLYGTTVAHFQNEFGSEAGLTIVETMPYPADTVDLSSTILRLQQNEVDVVLQTSYQNDSVLFFRQAHEAGFEPKAVIGGGGGYSLVDTAQAVGTDLIEGVFNADVTQYSVNPDAAPGIEDFVTAYETKYGSEPRSGHSLLTYVGAKVILEALAKAESLEPDAIVAAVKAIDIPEGGTAEGWGVKFGEDGQNERATMMGMQWQDGKLVTVWPPEAAIAEVRLDKAE
ncbi:ABC transporter substrate-binding protein [Geminicoccus roseus]|uniref:ABC transporter substrate-binding protein n=1 Tax=Geminicoccus roseus TaxID=404900 RepID=UPI0003F4B566|nr:ABC transporter substrate-binding protein [Geminicoccus roseus]